MSLPSTGPVMSTAYSFAGPLPEPALYLAPMKATQKVPVIRGNAKAARTPRWMLSVLVLVTCLVFGVIGWTLWPKQQPVVPLHLTAGTVQADLLTPEQVSKLAQTTV